MNSQRLTELLPIYHETLYEPLAAVNEVKVLAGSFMKKTLIVISEEDNNSLGLAFLQKIMLACKLELEDYYVLGINDVKINVKQIMDYQPEIVLLFGLGVDSEYFSFQKKPYIPFRFHQQKWLLCDSLKIIMNDDKQKSNLWVNGLKPIYGL